MLEYEQKLYFFFYLEMKVHMIFTKSFIGKIQKNHSLIIFIILKLVEKNLTKKKNPNSYFFSIE